MGLERTMNVYRAAGLAVFGGAAVGATLQVGVAATHDKSTKFTRNFASAGPVVFAAGLLSGVAGFESGKAAMIGASLLMGAGLGMIAASLAVGD